MFRNGLNMGFPLWVEKTVHGRETHWLSSKSSGHRGQQRRPFWQSSGTWMDPWQLIYLKKVQL